MHTTNTITAALVLAAATITGCARKPSLTVTTTTGGEVTSPSSDVENQLANPGPMMVEIVPLPGGASLEETANATEFDAFPEEKRAANGNDEHVERAIMANASDRTYRTGRSYSDIVGFYDSALRATGYTVDHRGSTTGSTFWRMRCPDGSDGRVIVRNTTPTTFEIVTAKSVVERPR